MKLEEVESLPEVTEVSANDVVIVNLHSDSDGPKLRKITIANLKKSLTTSDLKRSGAAPEEKAKSGGKEK